MNAKDNALAATEALADAIGDGCGAEIILVRYEQLSKKMRIFLNDEIQLMGKEDFQPSEQK